MFGINFIQSSSELGPPPKDVPPPTPIRLPQCNPQLEEPEGREIQPSLVRYLQQLQRPTELREAHFAALGVHLHADAPAEEIVPDPSFLPSSTDWDDISMDEAYRRDDTFRRPMSNGGRSPDARAYLERRNELSIPNQDAFRTVRRIKPEPGMQQPRLGNCYEFFKQMEVMATYWDDTSLPPPSSDNEEESPPLPPRPTEGGSEKPTTGAAPESNARSEADPEVKPAKRDRVTYRTSVGSQMPADFRHNFISAFVKLVSYGFGCNIFPPRVEPRLQILSPPSKKSSKSKASPGPQVASYFPSGCVFLSKAPTTREAARAGITEGPIAAVSARNTTNFTTSVDSNIDFGRELVAALITAQHRAREGQPEKRFGEGKWWATEKRWGGGEGGPIGREVDGDSIIGDKDSVGSDPERSATGTSQNTTEEKAGPSSSSSASHRKGGKPSLPSIPMRGQPASKKPRKNMSIYDSYRMVRPPSTNWDKKVKYAAIGKIRGADYDDVFVLSSLFHHLSLLRVRVPNRLLAVLGGEIEETASGEETKGRSWGKLETWRSKWFDLFVVEDRLEAMRLLWGIMGWVMRKEDADGDVAMQNA